MLARVLWRRTDDTLTLRGSCNANPTNSAAYQSRVKGTRLREPEICCIGRTRLPKRVGFPHANALTQYDPEGNRPIPTPTARITQSNGEIRASKCAAAEAARTGARVPESSFAGVNSNARRDIPERAGGTI